MGAIVAATKTNAELFGMAEGIGTIEDGKQADLILVDKDPLADISVLAEASKIRMVIKEGVVVKDLDSGEPLRGVGEAQHASIAVADR